MSKAGYESGKRAAEANSSLPEQEVSSVFAYGVAAVLLLAIACVLLHEGALYMHCRFHPAAAHCR